jgi:hypothetical protein
VFRYGDPGSEFFVILHGNVSVMVPTLVRCETKERFYDELMEKHEHVIWKSIPGDWESVKFHVEGEIKERERLRIAKE